jgi:hypothetical protein
MLEWQQSKLISLQLPQTTDDLVVRTSTALSAVAHTTTFCLAAALFTAAKDGCMPWEQFVT